MAVGEGGMHGEGEGSARQRGAYVAKGACMVKGLVCDWRACMTGSVFCRGTCMAEGHTWQGECMVFILLECIILCVDTWMEEIAVGKKCRQSEVCKAKNFYEHQHFMKFKHKRLQRK